MQLRKSFLSVMLLVLVSAFSFWGCSAGMKSFDAYDELEPIDALPEPTREHNVVVKINNVADVGTSSKNWAELYINDERIQLRDEVKGYQKDYSFHLRLKSGVYKIKAVYFAKGGKKEYEITTEDGRLRAYPDRRTVLSITLDKKLDGELKSEKNHFKETTESLTKTSTQSEVEQNIESESSSKASPVLPAKTITPKSLNELKNTITMNIRSVPNSAKIYIDGKFKGRSPLKVDVDPNENHEVKFSLLGFVPRTVFIDAKYFQDKGVFYLKRRLQPIR